MLGTRLKKLVFTAREWMEMDTEEVSFYLSLTFGNGHELVIVKE